ncbi:unnamed protein product [Meganyctiphanes norvegica]|uniref:Uncharacterized protein n=1 Tax=Meganyctiphanes norvegica TaxID=48144 RepID=A0AAV2PHA2_MEGNR
MIWRKFWTLICTLIFLTLIQKSICFRIKYDADVESEASISKTSTIDETKSTLRNFESDRIQDEDSDNILEKETKIKVADSNNIPEKESKSNSNIHPDSSEQKLVPENGESVKLPPETFKGFGRNPAMRKLIESEDPQLYEKLVNLINASQSEETENLALKVSSDPAVGNIQLQKPEPNINIENNFSVKQQPAEVFKGFGRNPAIRKLIENGDPNLYEKFVDYMKTPQPSLAGSVSITHDPESVDSMSDNSNSDNVITKFAQPESIKPLIVTSKTNEKIPDAASISEASVQSIEHKEQNVFINSEKALQQPLEETPKYLNTASLAQITQSSGKGEAQSIECDIPHLDINSRCFANVMEVTVTSRSSLLARISFVEAEGHIDMSGNTVNLYAVYGKKTTQGFMWQLQKGVTVGDVDVSCQNCHTLDLRMMVLVMENFKEKNKRCVVDLTCTQSNMPDQPSLESSQTSQTEIPKDSMITESDGSRVHSAKTTLNILKGIPYFLLV